MKIDASEIAQMSRKEKLLLMEALWADLSRSDTEVESPQWHEDTLRETDERVAAGKEPLVDWEDAKRDLRNRID